MAGSDLIGETSTASPSTTRIDLQLRPVLNASVSALGALLLRDLVVVWKDKWVFGLRTIIQPFLLCFVFLYVFPKIGQGIGGGGGSGAESDFATILVPGVGGVSIMFQ